MLLIDEIQNGSSLYHYGVPGMKWGVRKDRPTRSERKQRKKLTKDVAAAQKYVKIRSGMQENAAKASDEASRSYQKALAKTTLPWNKKKKQDAIDKASEQLQKRMTEEQDTRWKSDRAIKLANDKRAALESYIDALSEKYGEKNVKQLKYKNARVGEMVVSNLVKTGLRAENFPILGNSVSAKKINQWEREIRDEIAEKRSENMQKNRYA